VSKILVDTDVLIDYLRGREEAVALITSTDQTILISSLSIAELYAGIKGDDEEKTLEEFLGTLTVISVTSSLAKAAGRYRKQYMKSHSVGLADAVIAATAMQEGASLKTLNIKHYPMMEGLQPAYRK
jgi:predicted nucleic acid-binding protein